MFVATEYDLLFSTFERCARFYLTIKFRRAHALLRLLINRPLMSAIKIRNSQGTRATKYPTERCYPACTCTSSVVGSNICLTAMICLTGSNWG